MNAADHWRGVLRAALRDAMRAKQPGLVSVLREALAAIDAAEAVDLAAAPSAQAGVIAGGVAGLGAGDVPRRVLSADEVLTVLRDEVRARRAAAAEYAALGQPDREAALSAQADALDALLRG